MNYFCCDQHRRARVRALTTKVSVDVGGTLKDVAYNGIDYLEVEDSPNQNILNVHFLKPLEDGTLDAANITITGGERITGIHVLVPPVKIHEDVLKVTASQAGDFSTYTLAIVGPDGKRLPWMDPVLSSVAFSFRIDCIGDFDCDTCAPCLTLPIPEPEIDYLAKDYTSFRQLMLDRITALSPGWRERNAADLGVMLVELLAYVGDQLSYEQDAIATEAYLQTARQRISVKRHARLVDYFMHDGCNSRVFVQVHVGVDGVSIAEPGDTTEAVQFFTSVPGFDVTIDPTVTPPGGSGLTVLDRLLAAEPETFESMEEASFFALHNEIHFHTWGDARCALPKGATSATLKGNLVDLQPCDLLIFEEVKGPDTGLAADADPSHRWAVRLRSVTCTDGADKLVDPAVFDPATGTPQEITEITWHPDDALPFPLCVSSVTDAEDQSQPVSDVTVARGNIVLCDHGRTIRETTSPSEIVPSPNPALALQNGGGCGCDMRAPDEIPARYRPRLKESPLTQAATVNRTTIVDGKPVRRAFDRNASASSIFGWDMSQVRPVITLRDNFDGVWRPQRDLLASDEFAPEFVAEVDDSGRTTLRFGDDVNGVRPAPPLRFEEFKYRIGNGTRGNVGAGSIAHIAMTDSRIDGVRNIMPARGGIEPETIEQVRTRAPYAFRVQQRAVTADDYSEVTQRYPQVQRAATTVRWTGSWYTNFIAVDRLGGLSVSEDFRQAVTDHVEQFRMAGQDVEISAPVFVSLEIALDVCVLPDYFRSHVVRALLDVLSNGVRADGQLGMFHPDRFTFGQPVYLSPLIGAAQAVVGVDNVTFSKFQRQGIDDHGLALGNGVIPLDRLEIARLDNDPNFPEHGVLTINAKGGR